MKPLALPGNAWYVKFAESHGWLSWKPHQRNLCCFASYFLKGVWVRAVTYTVLSVVFGVCLAAAAAILLKVFHAIVWVAECYSATGCSQISGDAQMLIAVLAVAAVGVLAVLAWILMTAFFRKERPVRETPLLTAYWSWRNKVCVPVEVTYVSDK